MIIDMKTKKKQCETHIWHRTVCTDGRVEPDGRGGEQRRQDVP